MDYALNTRGGGGGPKGVPVPRPHSSSSSYPPHERASIIGAEALSLIHDHSIDEQMRSLIPSRLSVSPSSLKYTFLSYVLEVKEKAESSAEVTIKKYTSSLD